VGGRPGKASQTIVWLSGSMARLEGARDRVGAVYRASLEKWSG
jgi:hypothetical protein